MSYFPKSLFLVAKLNMAQYTSLSLKATKCVLACYMVVACGIIQSLSDRTLEYKFYKISWYSLVSNFIGISLLNTSGHQDLVYAS